MSSQTSFTLQQGPASNICAWVTVEGVGKSGILGVFVAVGARRGTVAATGAGGWEVRGQRKEGRKVGWYLGAGRGSWCECFPGVLAALGIRRGAATVEGSGERKYG